MDVSSNQTGWIALLQMLFISGNRGMCAHEILTTGIYDLVELWV